MLWYTHAIVGAAAGTLIFGPDSDPITVGICAASALLPDIDLPSSKLGSSCGALSSFTNLIFGHRTITHSLLGLGSFMMLFGLFLPHNYLNLIAVGYISHLVADMLNPAGIPIFWPITKRFSIPFVRTGGILEYLLIGVIIVFVFM